MIPREVFAETVGRLFEKIFVERRGIVDPARVYAAALGAAEGDAQ